MVVTVHLAVADDVFDCVLFCAVLFSHEMSLMRSWNELSQFLRLLLPILRYFQCYLSIQNSQFGKSVFLQFLMGHFSNLVHRFQTYSRCA